MSVPEPKRNKGKLDTCVLARDLCKYTIQITANEKVFKPEYQRAVTDKIVAAALNIHSLVWAANNTYLFFPDTYQARKNMQNKAMAQCYVLLSLIDLAKPLFHLSTKRVKYWSGKVIKTREQIKAWKESDKCRYAEHHAQQKAQEDKNKTGITKR